MKGKRERTWLKPNRGVFCIAVALAGFLSAGPAFADTKTWVTASGTNDWFTGANWSGGTVPTNGDVVIITNANIGILLTNTTDWLQSLTMSNRATLIFSNWDTALRATNVEIQSNATLTLPAAITNGQMSNRVYIVCTSFVLRVGGQIAVSGRGYQCGNGPGKGGVEPSGYYTSGGGHGGSGGQAYRPAYGGASGGGTYDLTNAPTMPGSGSGLGTGHPPGGNGGGAVRIDAGAGTVTIEGTINADGTIVYADQGGGSGGSIYINCGTFGGTSNGILSAKGGSVTGTSGSGGGGRIAVVYDAAFQLAQPIPRVRFNVSEGHGGYAGVIGTLYLTDSALLTTNLLNFEDDRIYGVTNWSLDALTITNLVITFAERRFALTVTNVLALNTATLKLGSGLTQTEYVQLNCGSLALTNTSGLYVYSGPTNAGTTSYGARVAVTNDIVVSTNAWIYPVSDGTNGGSVYFTANNVTINPGGGFNANGLGYNAGAVVGYGPGGGTRESSTYYGGGGGYGGKGGKGHRAGFTDGAGGNPYPWTNAPLRPGSGGGGTGGGTYGIGGGLVWIEAAGTITLDGTIKANGNPGYGAGSGSGGGIFIVADKFKGASTALLSANGAAGYNPGNGDYGGGGGGGRIAVWHRVSSAERQIILADPDRAAANVPRIVITNDFASTICGSAFLGSVIASNGWSYAGDSVTGTVVRLTVPPPRGTLLMTH